MATYNTKIDGDVKGPSSVGNTTQAILPNRYSPKNDALIKAIDKIDTNNSDPAQLTAVARQIIETPNVTAPYGLRITSVGKGGDVCDPWREVTLGNDVMMGGKEYNAKMARRRQRIKRKDS